jgi:putative ABC transport system substrate-binding protein
MRRRTFFGVLGAALVGWSLPAHTQPSQRLRRVAVFQGASSEDDPEARLNATILTTNLQKLGWTEGQNVRFDYRYSQGNLPVMSAHVAELVNLAPDVIVARGNRPAALMKQATSTIPIVFAQVGDPVGSNLIDNLARPGGNITGFTHFEASMGGKWLETLRDIAPSVRRVAVLMHPTTSANIAFLKAAEAAAPALGVTLRPTGVRDAAEIETAFAAIAGANTGVAVMPHDVTVAHYKLIVSLADRHRLPAVYPYRFYATQGGLVSYSFDTADHWRQVATYVDRILRGDKPMNLPVQAPIKFELVINSRTAKSLGLTVPPTLLARADEVIE